jgi:phenylpropionate dioxygenase-like ring-hydroxylating dioxygenase large terminal subunit
VSAHPASARAGSRYPFPATPDGWYSVGRADAWAPGSVRPLRYFGRELVGFRGEDGRARVFDAHCPHLGAHLGHGGRVCGEGIVCPFHGWRFDGEGQLAEVPGLGRRPPGVRARAWPVTERNGFVFVWYHAKDEPPSYPMIGYREDEARWTEWRSSPYTVRVHVQDLTENILDRAHFLAVHDMATPDRQEFEVRFEGTSLVVDQTMKVTAVSERGVHVRSRTTTCGPGVAAVEVKQGALDMLTYITQTPIDDELTEVGLHFSMQRLPDADATRAVSELNDRITNAQFAQDVPIWENKIYRERPALTEIDGPVAQYRRWFRQFYSDWAAGA